MTIENGGLQRFGVTPVIMVSLNISEYFQLYFQLSSSRLESVCVAVLFLPCCLDCRTFHCCLLTEREQIKLVQCKLKYFK